ncbi:MAG: hypothetical protein JO112_06730 [Planctomycetes bacterium]|nr:hypothetical protein [Planctomycetota bacterium]
MPARFSILAALLAAWFLASAGPSSQAGAPKSKMVLRSYAVADLIIPLSRAQVTLGKKEQGEQTNQPPSTLEDRLMNLIVGNVQPASWSQNGGEGTIDYFPQTMSLVINQTPHVQEQIVELLAGLRRIQDMEVAVEVRVLTTSEAFAEGLGGNSEVKANFRDLGHTFLNDSQLHQLMDMVQGDRRTNVMQAPKMTLCNGQAGTLSLMDRTYFMTGMDVEPSGKTVTFHPKNEPTDLGFRLTLQPVISPDLTSVQVYLKMEQTNLASPEVPLMPVTFPIQADGQDVPVAQFLQQPQIRTMTIEKTAVIPDGKTVVFGGLKREVESRTEFGPPILSKIPYLNRLFKNVGYSREPELVYLLVTPRILPPEEVEGIPTQTQMACAVRQFQERCLGTWLGDMISDCLDNMTAKCEVPTAEEQDLPDAVETPVDPQAGVLAELLKAYDDACAAGHSREARKYARAALMIDPLCFHSISTRDPNRRMNQLLNQSEDLGLIEDEWDRIWLTDQPSPMTPDRVHGGIE